MSSTDPVPERYEIQRPIGLGGHAEVLLGVIRGVDGFQRPVAIKRVRADLANQRTLVAMLIEEAHHAARLCHPNVVSVLDLVRDAERRPYLVMEHGRGRNGIGRAPARWRGPAGEYRQALGSRPSARGPRRSTSGERRRGRALGAVTAERCPASVRACRHRGQGYVDIGEAKSEARRASGSGS